MEITFVLGTRPEVIKLAPVILAAKAAKIKTHVVHTGQHGELATTLLKSFGIVPDHTLDVMTKNQTLSTLSAKLLLKLNKLGSQISADYLVVQGDTTSAIVGAYWGYCNRIPVAHVEAGLRTYNLDAPFPEEGNRQLISRISKVHFTPTLLATQTLRNEGIAKSQIFQVGNTSIDSLRFLLNHFRADPLAPQKHISPETLNFIRNHPFVLVTAHRRESFGQSFVNICEGILSVVNANPKVRVIYPVHPNPNVREPVEKLLGHHPQILLCKPLPYIPFVYLMKMAKVLLTDSGGVQEEGPSLRKPILVMRNQTERPEGIQAGYAKLVGTDPIKIKKETLNALKAGCQGKGGNPYGDGRSAQRIIEILKA